MNTDFPRVLSLLRKEHDLSQKQAATDLGIAQALLSHYEKGKRECGLDFLVKAADYYGVSTDYLLGRSAVRTGAVLQESEMPRGDEANPRELGSLSAALTKKLLWSSIDIIFSLLAKMKNQKLTQNISTMLSLTVYRAFRLVYRANPSNDPQLFSVSEAMAYRAAAAGTLVSEGKALAASNAGTAELPVITTAGLEQEYQKQATALLSLVKNCESVIKNYD